MKLYTIIRKGTKNNPIFMVHKEYRDFKGSEIVISEEDDNLPVFQPYPEYIHKEELYKFSCEIVEVEFKIL
jgi:hypothetical protein